MTRPGPTLAPVRDEPCVGQDISVGHPRCPVQFQPCDEVPGEQANRPVRLGHLREPDLHPQSMRLHWRRKPKRFDLVTRRTKSIMVATASGSALHNEFTSPCTVILRLSEAKSQSVSASSL